MPPASGIIAPTVICGLFFNDWLGGYFYAAVAKMVFVHHTTFLINSLAHSNLFGVYFSDPNTGTVVGGEGTILRTR